MPNSVAMQRDPYRPLQYKSHIRVTLKTRAFGWCPRENKKPCLDSTECAWCKVTLIVTSSIARVRDGNFQILQLHMKLDPSIARTSPSLLPRLSSLSSHLSFRRFPSSPPAQSNYTQYRRNTASPAQVATWEDTLPNSQDRSHWVEGTGAI
jgi:hypothetical protein